jgi:hypothetical protein
MSGIGRDTEFIRNFNGITSLTKIYMEDGEGVATCLLVFAELISSTLQMEAICSSETSVETRRTTRRHIPEDDTLQVASCMVGHRA